MPIVEIYPGQRLRVLPEDIVQAASQTGLTSRLLVTDAGYFPRALHHKRARPRGTTSTIIIVCASGRGYCRTTTGVHRIEAAQSLIITAGAAHEYWADDADPWTIWWLHALGPDQACFEAEIRRNTSAPGVVINNHDLLQVMAHMEDVVKAMEADDTRPNVVRAAGAAWRVMAELTADFAEGPRARVEPARAAQEYLREHYSAPLQVNDLARRFGYSTSHFSTIFRSAAGSGVVEYVKRLRIAQAAELLGTTSEPISDIAQTVGYSDPLYFSRQFRSVHGCSPSAFRSALAVGGEPNHVDTDHPGS
ncbi:MAG: AraC family transcriptional regulator [Propionicimonas sp.]